jgi:spore maturation protein CgeB
MTGFCKKAFEKLGNTVRSVTYNDRRISSRISIVFPLERMLCELLLAFFVIKVRPAFILVIKGDAIRSTFISNIRRKRNIIFVNYWIDDPRALKVSSRISPFYDLFFTNSFSCIKKHQDAGCRNVKFLSFGFDPSLHRRLVLKPEEASQFGSDISFSGTLTSNRMDTLTVLSDFNLKIWSSRTYSNIGDFYRIAKRAIPPDHPLFNKITGESVWGEAMVKVCNASELVINIHYQNAPTMRDFEVTACGAFLLTDYVEGLEELFKIGEEIVCFKSNEELLEKTRYFLAHKDERNKIAENGYARTVHNHGYVERMKKVIEEVQGSKKINREIRR